MDRDSGRQKELEALALLDAATRLAGDRGPLRAVQADFGDVADAEDASRAEYGDSCSADEQHALAWQLVDHADVLANEGRSSEAYAFLRAAEALPKGPGQDPDLLERLLRIAVALELERDAARHRRALETVAPERARIADDPRLPAPTPPRREERYSHPKFGVGTLVRREGSALRVRFDDGERVIVADRLTRVE